MTSFKIDDLLTATGARLVAGNDQASVKGIATDSRTLQEGELFLALSGPNFDGNCYAEAAIERGAAALLLREEDSPPESSVLEAGPPVLVHPNPRRALADLASWHRNRLDLPVIGITGSCGKTTTKGILMQLLAHVGEVAASPASYNNDIGVPLTLFLAGPSTDHLVVEMGTNGPGEIATLCRIARPTAGVITNVGASHLERLVSEEGVAREKGDLIAGLNESAFCVLNADCRWTENLRGRTPARVLTFSVEGDGDFDARDVWFHAAGTTFRLGEREITSPLLGLHNVQNLLAALATCHGLGLDLDRVLPAVSKLKGGRRRMERIELEGLTLFDDTYNANPQSALASVRVLCGLHGHTRRVFVLGEMHELGDGAAELHSRVGREAAAAGVDCLVTVGPLARFAAEGAREAGLPAENTYVYEKLEQAIAGLPEMLADGDVVLVKGSRAAGLERLVSALIELERSRVD